MAEPRGDYRQPRWLEMPTCVERFPASGSDETSRLVPFVTSLTCGNPGPVGQ
ncbi:MAG: hypothetical protein KDA83_09530 [Planctomycetales bacterium]|nr:hypothetical protein [Planctomycetales bacterium]